MEKQLPPHLDTVRSVEDVRMIQKSEFWERHHSTLGNYKKVFPIVMLLIFPILIFALDIIPWIILNALHQHNVMYIMAAIHFLCDLLIFGFIIYWIHRIGMIADKFGIG